MAARALPAPALPTRTPCLCLHCGASVPAGDGDFCCRGCEEVHKLLAETGLTRYYDLGGGDGHPVVRSETDHKWLEPIAARLATTEGLQRIVLDVQGLHCSACVWLFERVFARHAGSASIVVNPAVGAMDLTVAGTFDLAGFVTAIEAFGYRVGPPIKANRSGGDTLVWRMGVCIAIAMNTMIFGFAIYCGLSDGPVHRLFHALDFALSFASVAIGGSVFIKSAWLAARRRVLHLDLPIALGILFAFASSSYTYLTRGGGTSYFDTINVFIALMLVGRFLQERVLAKNRAFLLASDGADGLFTRRVESGRVTLVRCSEVKESDVLMLGRGDLVPIDAELADRDAAVFSLDWINGESAPRTYRVGEIVPAGAFCQDERAVRVKVRGAFDASSLVPLLRTETRRDEDRARATAWHRRITAYYVSIVLALGAVTFAGWFFVTGDLVRTLDVVAALLIVTCPCAFGIATPLAYEIAQANLRRAGLYVRTPGFLDRAAEVTRVVFDKTGTLTTGELSVATPASLLALPDADRARLYDLAARSSHPKSRAVARALERSGVAIDETRDVREIAGAGLELEEEGHLFRLGAPTWATRAGVAAPVGADVVFSRDGEVLAACSTVETLRADAREEVLALRREGYDVCILSGDGEAATRKAAESCGVDPDHVAWERSPSGKAAWLESEGHPRTLFLGDGINDTLVAEEAWAAGTPAIDRPFMAARSDFYFVTPGLHPIRLALQTSKRVARAVHANLAVAVFYNAITVTLAVSGLMTPLLCAVLMPLSSLSTVLATMASLRTRSETWKS